MALHPDERQQVLQDLAAQIVQRRLAAPARLMLEAIGPLSFSLSRPLNKQADDDTQAFQFTIGQGF